MRKMISILLLAAVALSLAACGAVPASPEADTAESVTSEEDARTSEAAALPQLSPEEQKQILEQNRALWAFTEPYESPWFYTYTDLDHNGRLEVMAATTQGSGVYTYGRLYELIPDGSGIVSCYRENPELEGPDDWPEIILDSLSCYHDAATDLYYYPCENLTRDGYAHQYCSWQILCLKDGAAEWEFLASKNVNWRNEETGEDYAAPLVTCMDASGNPITEQEYDGIAEQRLAGMEKTELPLDWVQVENPWPEEGAAEGQNALFAVGPAVVITKNPSSEAVTAGGRTWFIAHADNAFSLTWQLLDPEGRVYSLEEAMAAHPGLELQALEGDTLAVSGAPLSLNGWGIQAVFDGDNNLAVTEPAYLYVGDFVTAYAGPIGEYRTAYASGNHRNAGYMWEHELSEVAAYSTGVGYALKDLDKNGIPELLIYGTGPEDGNTERTIFALYTLENGQPVNVFFSSARMVYFLRTDNSILYRGSGGASYTYIMLKKLSGSTLEDTEMVFTDYDEASNTTVFYAQEGYSEDLPSDKSVRITEDEYYTRWQGWEEGVYVPPLTAVN